MDTNAISIQSLDTYYGINAQRFRRQYKEKLSGFRQWNKKSHALDYLIYPKNIGEQLAIDETAVSNGELYTILTNKLKKGKKGSIVGIFKGTKASEIISHIRKHIPAHSRNRVKEITLDMAGSMNLIAKSCFIKADRVTDRFHVQKLASEAVQELRIKYRWKVLSSENRAYKRAKRENREHTPKLLANGDSKKQVLARSRYLLFKSMEKWTNTQCVRANILFDNYPDIESAYHLANQLRCIYNQVIDPDVARLKLAKWFDEIEKAGFDSFNSIRQTFQTHSEQIINYFKRRSTNAFAESFNSKIKEFRRSFRGVVDVKYFLFRLTKIYA